jgi:hypothetical protein
MATLLSWANQQEIKPFDANNASKYNSIATEIENTILRDLIGVKILQNIQATPTNSNYKLLLQGDSFTDTNGDIIRHRGLNFCLAYWNYEKYIGQSFVYDSFSGFVQKNRPDSENITEGTIKRLQKEVKQIAMSEWQLIDLYLIEKNTIYPNYYRGQQSRPYYPKFRSLRNSSDNSITVSYDLKTRTIV